MPRVPGRKLKRQAQCFCDNYFDSWREPPLKDVQDALLNAHLHHWSVGRSISEQQSMFESLDATVRSILEMEDVLGQPTQENG